MKTDLGEFKSWQCLYNYMELNNIFQVKTYAKKGSSYMVSTIMGVKMQAKEEVESNKLRNKTLKQYEYLSVYKREHCQWVVEDENNNIIGYLNLILTNFKSIDLYIDEIEEKYFNDVMKIVKDFRRIDS
jgi:hypothetical protein